MSGHWTCLRLCFLGHLAELVHGLRDRTTQAPLAELLRHRRRKRDLKLKGHRLLLDGQRAYSLYPPGVDGKACPPACLGAVTLTWSTPQSMAR